MFREILLNNCDCNQVFLATEFNQRYIGTIKFESEKYYKSVKSLFVDKEVVVFAGIVTLNNITYDVLEWAKFKEYIFEGGGQNVYSQYKQLYEKAKTISKDKLLLFALGSVSKLLVYDLKELGYLAWDVGHIFKDYDSYMKGILKSELIIKKFYAPDT